MLILKFFYFINNNINENGVLIHFTLKSRNEALLSKTLKNKILDSLLLQDDFTSSQRLAPVSSSSSASQLNGLPTTLAPTLPATRPPQVPPLANDDIGQPPNVSLLQISALSIDTRVLNKTALSSLPVQSNTAGLPNDPLMPNRPAQVIPPVVVLSERQHNVLPTTLAPALPGTGSPQVPPLATGDKKQYPTVLSQTSELSIYTGVLNKATLFHLPVQSNKAELPNEPSLSKRPAGVISSMAESPAVRLPKASVASAVVIPQSLISSCVSNDGFSCQIIVYTMDGISPHSTSDDRKFIAKSIAMGSDEQVAESVMQNTAIRKHILKEVFKKLDQECDYICKPSSNSILRQKNVEQLEEFSWEKFLENEIKEKANILHNLVTTVCGTKFSNSRNALKTSERKIPAMGMALACLLKARNQNMSAAQVLNSLVLMRGHLTVMVSIHPVGKAIFQWCKNNRTQWKFGFHLLSEQRNYTLFPHRSTLFSFSCKNYTFVNYY